MHEVHLQEVPFAGGAYASHSAVLLRCDAPELCCCVFFGGRWGGGQWGAAGEKGGAARNG